MQAEGILHLKYRPQTLDEVMGNEDVIEVLHAQISGAQAMPRSILLYGPTGCGKTSLARIIAHGVGCSGADLNEIDSASFGRGIDTIEISGSRAYTGRLRANAVSGYWMKFTD